MRTGWEPPRPEQRLRLSWDLLLLLPGVHKHRAGLPDASARCCTAIIPPVARDGHRRMRSEWRRWGEGAGKAAEKALPHTVRMSTGTRVPHSLCHGVPAVGLLGEGTLLKLTLNPEMKRERPAHPRRPPKAGTRPSPQSPPPPTLHTGHKAGFVPSSVQAGGTACLLRSSCLLTARQGARGPEPSAVLNPHPLPAIKCFDKRTPRADAARMQACLRDPSASPAWPPAGRPWRPPAGSGAAGLKWQSNVPFTRGTQTHQMKVLRENASPQGSANSKPSQKGAQHQSKHPPETPSLSGCSETWAPSPFSNSYSQNKM